MGTKKEVLRLLDQSPYKIRNVLRAQDLQNRGLLEELFKLSDLLEHRAPKIMKGKTLTWYEGERSTRTQESFLFAAEKLGGRAHPLSSITSSEGKAESVEDTVLTLAQIGSDVIVLRHPDEDAVWRAGLVCPVPLINGGSGKEHHPTQALLDVYAIWRKFQRIDGLTISLIGDLKYGRTTNSLAYLLTKFKPKALYLVSPEHLRMKGELVYYLRKGKGLEITETTDLGWALEKADVLYQTRKQKERTNDPNEHEGLAPYKINPRVVNKHMKKGAIILHPWPRGDELSREVDTMPQAHYIKAMRFGKLIRTALLAKIVYGLT